MPQLEKDLTETQPDQPETPVRQTGPCVMVIFGATGDLTARKLFPALYNLAKSNMLSREFAIVGVAKNELSTDQFPVTARFQSFAVMSLARRSRGYLNLPEGC